MLAATHHAAMTMSDTVIAWLMVMPSESHPRMRIRQATNGTQLPMYPHAYPAAETLSEWDGVVTSTSIES